MSNPNPLKTNLRYLCSTLNKHGNKISNNYSTNQDLVSFPVYVAIVSELRTMLDLLCGTE